MNYRMRLFFMPFTICRTFNSKLIDPRVKIFCSFLPNRYSTLSLSTLSNPSIRVTPVSFTSFKRQKSAKSREEESDDEIQFKEEDSSLSRDSKVLKFHTTSMRTDLILKSALGISRNKIEKSFYESKIRVNGRKILKKSAAVNIGDEVDLIKVVSESNPDHLYVARVEILKITAKEENIQVTVRRFKNLLIENYEEDPYKGTANDET